MGKNILIISGEASGDLHGSALISALKRLDPSVTVKGMGGEKMRREGLSGIDSSAISVVGIAEVVKKIPAIIKAYWALKKMLYAEAFDAVVLIDFPDFNLRFAGAAKKRGTPVVYYISPQVWAWRRRRIKAIAGLVTKMLVLFPFEKTLYAQAGVDVECVGHPLMDSAVSSFTKEAARSFLGVEQNSIVIAILPGSRREEVERLLKPMAGAIKIVKEKLAGEVTVILPAAPTIPDGLIERFLPDDSGIKVVRNDIYAALRASDAAIVASGTATLETALIGTPMVIVYKVSALSYLVGKFMIGVKHIGLPNIIRGKTVVPELIQNDATPEKISKEVLSILSDTERIKMMQDDYKKIRETLEGGNAAANAARAILNVIESRGGSR